MMRTRTTDALLLAAWLLLAACDVHIPDGVAQVPNERTVRCNQQFGDPAQSPYILPYTVGRTYRVIQSYCPQNPAWGHHRWLAYDFDLSTGDTILASQAGTVTAVRENFADGTRVCGEENWVFIRHADGTIMSYVHLTTNGAFVQVGDEVAQGEPIGLSGDSGCSSGPHLHVALFRNGTNFNAENTLPFNYRNAEGALDERNGLLQNGLYKALADTGMPKGDR